MIAMVTKFVPNYAFVVMHETGLTPKHKPKIVYLEQTGHYTFKSRNNNNSSSNNMIILNGEIDLFYLPADI